MLRSKMPEAKMLAVEICFDLKEISWTWAWSVTKCASGLEKQFIANLGMEKCKKSEATMLIIIGERPENNDCVGVWKNKTPNVWLRPIQK